MADDLFNIDEMGKRADELVERARQQARKLRVDVERRLKEVADELERTHGRDRAAIERELTKRREQILQTFEQRMRQSLDTYDAAKRERLAPVVEHVIKAFRDHARE